MSQAAMTRRQAMAAGVGIIVAGLSGCNAARTVIIISNQVREWAKVVRIIVNSIRRTVVVVGSLDGKEVRTELSLTKEDLEAIKNGAMVEVETKSGRQKIKPTLQD